MSQILIVLHSATYLKRHKLFILIKKNKKRFSSNDQQHNAIKRRLIIFRNEKSSKRVRRLDHYIKKKEVSSLIFQLRDVEIDSCST